MASFLYFIFRDTKNRRLGRLICRLRAYVLQNNDFYIKTASCLTPFGCSSVFLRVFPTGFASGSDFVV